MVILEHPFDVIGITETRISVDVPIMNLEIDGYKFHHTKTTSKCGGTGVYVKNNHQYEIITELSTCIENVCEAIFLDIKNNKGKSITFGCIYRHPSVQKQFLEKFLEPTLQKLSKEKRTCALAGDFNYDLLKYESHTETNAFYDILSAHAFRPLILHPSRVTSKSNTLIDNIFINDLSCSSIGGNITTSISDHFPQFCQTNILESEKSSNTIKYACNFKTFNDSEFFRKITIA